LEIEPKKEMHHWGYLLHETNIDRHTRVLNVLGELALEWGYTPVGRYNKYHVNILMNSITLKAQVTLPLSTPIRRRGGVDV
jgi:hypothetical protein